MADKKKKTGPPRCCEGASWSMLETLCVKKETDDSENHDCCDDTTKVSETHDYLRGISAGSGRRLMSSTMFALCQGNDRPYAGSPYYA